MPRTFGDNFNKQLTAASKEPRYVVQVAFDIALTDFVYFLSHDDTAYPDGATTNAARVANVPAISQTIDPVKAKSTIGTMNVNIQDTGGALTTLIATKLAGGDGLRSKRVRLYVGFKGLAWDDYELFQTQVIDSWTYKDGLYTLNCKDIQRTTKTRLFEPKKTVLDAEVDTTATAFTPGSGTGVITVKDTSDFETVYHGLGWDDAASSTVGYIKIDNEIIRYTGKTATTFTGCVGARLGTNYALHKTDTTNDSTKTKVEEHIYLDLPVCRLIYAIWTGSLYGEAATLPAHWNLGIDSSYVSLSSFTSLQTDLWPADNSKGRRARFKKIKPQSGKKFVEDELMRLAGCTPIIFNDGQIGIKRLIRVSEKSSFQKLLNASNIISYSDITYDATQVVNTVVVNWNYNIQREEFTRQSIFTDAVSQAEHQVSDAIVLDMYGLDGSHHTPKTIGALFDFLRERYTGPPKLMTVECTLSVAALSVADHVRVQLDQVRDSIEGTLSLDQTFEIRRMTIDPERGKVILQLFGSSEAPKYQSYTSDATALDAGFYSTTSLLSGNKLDTYCSSTYLDGSVLHIDSSNSFTGGATIPGTSNAAVYWYDGDVYFDHDDGVSTNVQLVQTLSENVVFAIEGFVTYECKFDGVGGSTGTGAQFFGTTRSQGGGYYIYYGFYSTDGNTNVGDVNTVPYIDINYNGGTSFSDLMDAGFPTNLRGSEGPDGNSSGQVDGTTLAGGAGGAGGAGLAFICQGIDQAGDGYIDLSGDPGSTGSYSEVTITQPGRFNTNTYKLWGGSGGGGAPGALLILLDGSAFEETDVLSTFVANLSDCPNSSPGSTEVGYDETDLSEAAWKVITLQAPETANIDNPLTTTKGSIAVVEQTNTPETPAENLASLEITLTPPSDSNYSHHNVYYKLTSEPDTAYQYHSTAANETVIVAAMDGTSYDIKAVPVSIYGVESTDFVTTTQVMSSAAGGCNLATGNYIQSGQTAYDTGTGFFIGNVSGTPKLSIGNSAGNKVTWDGTTLSVTGTLSASLGYIAGWTISSTALTDPTGHIIMDSSSGHFYAENTAGTNYVKMDGNGIYGYDNTLGTTFRIYNDGTAPLFASGTINTTTFNISSTGVLQTSATVGDGSGASAGVIINNAGIKGFPASSSTPNFHLDATDGSITSKSGTIGGWSISTSALATASNEMVIQAGSKYISVGGITFGTQGFQVKYNSGTPQLYVGDGSDKYLKFDGTDVSMGRDTQLLGADAYNNDTIYLAGYMQHFTLNDISVSGGTVTKSYGSADFAVSGSGDQAIAEISSTLTLISTTWANDRRLRIKVASQATIANVDFYVGTGNQASDHVGFRFDSDGNIYAETNNGLSSTSSSLTTFAASTKYDLEIVFTSTSATFYVDGTGYTPITTTLPSGGFSSARHIYGRVDWVASSGSTASIGEFRFEQQ